MMLYLAVIVVGLIGHVLATNLDLTESVTEMEYYISPINTSTVTVNSSECSCGRSNEGLVGFYDTTYPMMAGLLDFKQRKVYCGATIITARHLLTAARCVQPYSTSDVGVFIGHYSITEARAINLGVSLPKQFIIHEKYENSKERYDIAVILLETKLKFNENIGTVCLPTRSIQPGNAVKLLGWGRTENVTYSEVLMKVTVDTVNIEQCQTYYSNIDENYNNCMYRADKGPCTGDEGGPVLWRHPGTTSFTLVSVMSNTTSCGKYAALNIDTATFVPWIKTVVSDTDANEQICTSNLL